MLADDIRRTFLAFFEARDHKLYPSSSLIPPPETNLMLTTAGMVQFRPYFLGTEKPSHPRATSVQKSFRTTDVDEVGDQSHLTLFEMLGNFSFGDYFKKEAIAWAWELLTTEFGLDPERLWATVYEEDDEAEQLWLEVTPIPAERIQRLGKNENFWDMGVAGPGGPNSEIWYDRGPAYGEEGGPAVNDTRYLEVYNLVFIQYETDGAKNIVKPLPAPSVDTGMGLERITTVLQEASSIYDTDLFSPILDRAAGLTGRTRGASDDDDRLLRTLTDHARSTAFLIADGVTPSNEGRGYVLRRVMRRAITKARLAGVNTKLLQELTEAVVERFGHVYPELQRNSEGIALVAAREEERFTQTLDIGLRILEESIEKATDVLPGNVAFKLQDTYGFPLDITKDVATERGLTVDVDGYERLMEEQRTRSREVGEAGKVRAGAGPRIDVAPTEFLGYEKRTDTGKVVAIAKGVEPAASLAPGEEADVVFDRTPFYPEGGGQIGDRGLLLAADAKAEVLDTQKVGAAIMHRVRVTDGEIAVGMEMELHVDPALRTGAEQAHTATHILHHTLRNTLGEHVRQMGSLVEPGRLRFDFSHFSSVDPGSLSEIEETINTRVESDDKVTPFDTSYREAIDKYHAMAFFEEKYGDVVRVVEIGDYSYELCGGTHVPQTGHVGFVKLLGESSIGSNIRRVEALTGVEGLRWVNVRLREAERAAELVRTAPDELVAGIQRLLKTQKELERQIAAGQRSGISAAVNELVPTAQQIDSAQLVVARRTEEVGVLRELAVAVRDKIGRGAVILGTSGEGSVNLVAAVTKDLGVDARELLRPAAERIGGGAGGKPDLALAGGRNPEALDDALEVARQQAQGSLQ
ncbi:MAG TPA: alanine--tRNA ligase [Actinomycetota bacterium]|jgi:alanyl-tRNA synthetase|nr:alanine--tRNA ligase [Actinomycetota bacterium]